MAVLHDYMCVSCEEVYLDQWEKPGKCLDCGKTNIIIIYLKAPAKRSHSTKNYDAIAEDLVGAYGFSDFNNNPSTAHSLAGASGVVAEVKEAGINLVSDGSGFMKPEGEDISKVIAGAIESIRKLPKGYKGEQIKISPYNPFNNKYKSVSSKHLTKETIYYDEEKKPIKGRAVFR